MIRSPGLRKVPPQLWATRLIPSVAPRTKTTSSAARAPMNAAVRRRAASKASVISAERW
jgi:hypothetical protein